MVCGLETLAPMDAFLRCITFEIDVPNIHRIHNGVQTTKSRLGRLLSFAGYGELQNGERYLKFYSCCLN